MIIDIIFAVLIVLAVIKGYQKGLIIAIFSLVAFVVGLAAALKLSAVVAGYIGKSIKVSEQWLPVIAFILVFLIVILLIRWGAALIQKSAETVMLGWANRLGGVLFFAIIYILIYSVFIFYAEQIGIIKEETIKASNTYSFLHPIGPKVIEGFGNLIPIFKNMFQELQDFFSNFSERITIEK